LGQEVIPTTILHLKAFRTVDKFPSGKDLWHKLKTILPLDTKGINLISQQA